MLVLSRKRNESVVINNDITVTVVEIRGDKVRLGIVAPREASVHRQEVYEAIHGRLWQEPEPTPWVVMPRPPEVGVATSVTELLRELSPSNPEPRARFTSEGGILPSEAPREKVAALRERAQSLFDRLLRGATRETLGKVIGFLTELVEGGKRRR